MYGIYAYMYHKNQLNVGKYSIHGSYGIGRSQKVSSRFLAVSRSRFCNLRTCYFVKWYHGTGKKTLNKYMSYQFTMGYGLKIQFLGRFRVSFFFPRLVLRMFLGIQSLTPPQSYQAPDKAIEFFVGSPGMVVVLLGHTWQFFW